MDTLSFNYGWKVPTQVLPFLFLGCENCAKNLKHLQSINVRYIVNATSHIPNFFPEHFNYFDVPIDDEEGEQISKYFNDSIDFIERNKEKGNVLVHCVMGVSRSVSIVLAYLLSKQGFTLASAFKKLKKIRPRVNPNPGFWTQLINFEIEITQKPPSVKMVKGRYRKEAQLLENSENEGESEKTKSGISLVSKL